MPQLQNLVLTDRQATPVNHTFTPRDIIGNVGTVVESAAYPVGDKRVTISMLRNSTGKYVGTLKGTFPIVQEQTINGVTTPVVVRSAYAEMVFKFDATSTEQERKDVVGMMASALGTSATLVNDALTKLQGIY